MIPVRENVTYRKAGFIFAGMRLLTRLALMVAALTATGYAAQALPESPVPESLVRIAPGVHAILVEKSTQTLFVYGPGAAGPELTFTAACSTGEVAGPKFQAGDKKTPDGVYFITDRYEDRYLSPIYGKLAFPIDYPNFLDRKSGRNGSAIWLHGTNKALKPMDSNGCVALENSNILALAEFVDLNRTPVIVTEKIQMADPSVLSRQADMILAMLDRWLAAHVSGSYHDYLSVYDSGYLPDIRWWEAWDALKKRGAKHNLQLAVTAGQVGIYRQNDLWVTLFSHGLKSSGVKSGKKERVMGRKKLFLRKTGQGFTIIGDVYQTFEKGFGSSPHPLLTAGNSLVPAVEDRSFFIQLVKDWIDAWSSKAMDTYAAFYSDRFSSDGLNKAEWVARKKMLARKYQYIEITGSRFHVKQNGPDECVVRFYQTYRSSGFSTQGTKTLVFIRKGDEWKIFQENWKEN